MKCVILAGGKGTRISESGSLVPKPLVEIGGRPIMWHVMKIYEHYDMIDEFIICCGHKGHYIKEYFMNYHMHNSDVTVDLHSGEVTYIHRPKEAWKVTLVDTGNETLTGGRLMRIKSLLGEDQVFAMTYGDGLSNVDLNRVLRFHMNHKKIATVTAVKPAGRFGTLSLEKGGRVDQFSEKTDHHNSWINGGFFFLNPGVFDYLTEDVMFEGYPLESLASDGQLMAYRHDGFFMPMDTQKDRMELEKMWEQKRAQWKVWNV